MQIQQQSEVIEVPVTTYEEREVTRVTIDLADAGEIRRFHRVILAGANNVEGEKSTAFANDLVEALGVTEASAAKQ